jgi:hypothetical protein
MWGTLLGLAVSYYQNQQNKKGAMAQQAVYAADGVTPIDSAVRGLLKIPIFSPACVANWVASLAV